MFPSWIDGHDHIHEGLEGRLEVFFSFTRKGRGVSNTRISHLVTTGSAFFRRQPVGPAVTQCLLHVNLSMLQMTIVSL